MALLYTEVTKMTPAEMLAYFESPEGKKLEENYLKFISLCEAVKIAVESPVYLAYKVIIQKLGEIVEHPCLQSEDHQVRQLKTIFLEYMDGMNNHGGGSLIYGDVYAVNHRIFNRGNQVRKGEKGGKVPKKPEQKKAFIEGWEKTKKTNKNITPTHYIKAVYKGVEAESTLRNWVEEHEKSAAIEAWLIAKLENQSITQAEFSQSYHFHYKNKSKIFCFLKGY